MYRKYLLFIFTLLLLSGCAKIKEASGISTSKKDDGKIYSETKPDKKGSIIELPKLANLSSDEVEKILGESKKESNLSVRRFGKIYTLKQGDAELRIKYDDENKISEMRLELSTKRDSSDDLLRAGGFDLSDSKPDWENAIVKKWENRVFNGVRFEEISAHKHPPSGKWDEVEVLIER